MRKIIILIIFFFSYNILFSQQDTTIKSKVVKINEDSIALNSLYIDIVGHHLGYGINYDRTIFYFRTIFSDYTCIIPRIGFTANFYNIALPVILALNFGKIHRFELGIGSFYEFKNVDWNDSLNYPNNRIKWILNIGYRYQKLDGGFVCRVGFSPFFPSKDFDYFAGVSFGYAW